MQKVDIDLKQEPQEENETLSVTPGEKEADESVESDFPHFHYESAEPLEIPPKGKMIIEYEVVFDNSEDEEAEGYNYKVDVKRILGVEGAVAAPSRNETEMALDKLASEQAPPNVPS